MAFWGVEFEVHSKDKVQGGNVCCDWVLVMLSCQSEFPVTPDP